jgi:hypothetical protein
MLYIFCLTVKLFDACELPICPFQSEKSFFSGFVNFNIEEHQLIGLKTLWCRMGSL